MPPSPQLRRSSPGRELRMETSHNRGHSFESGMPLKAKDDDLVLFSEMQNHERENFLLHTSEDFDESISKLKYFPDFKLGITIPPRGESSDLLNADAEKNDYDWLLTPPETPLFPSLDDEPQPINMSRGRTRTQPISISKPSMADRTPRTNRSSASPHRLSPSPRSSYNVVQSRARPSSAPHSSPPPVRPTTPLRRPSTPPMKPSTPTPRSSTPTMRRMSTGSTGPFSSRGTSPIKSTRGNSASPKLRGWQSNLPGFSTDAPPNLRTSLSDRSSSRVRGLSPASANGRDSSSKVRRQSVSPSAIRSANLCNSGRNGVGSYSKSVASPGDDDADSVHSVSASASDGSLVRKYGAFGNSRSIAVSKKPIITQSASSAPKRSFDSSLRQMDQCKTPPNMFRPLLSSVPATTFYVGKANSTHRPLFSRNSSLTTSSNASSELGATIAPEMEDSDHEQSELTSEWERQMDPEIHDEIFVFDKLDGISEDPGHDIHAEKSHNDRMIRYVNSEELDFSTETTSDAVNTELTSQSLCIAEKSDVSCKNLIGTCSLCGKDFRLDIHVEGDICQECAAVEGLLASGQTGKDPDMPRAIDALDSKTHLQKEMPELHKNNYQVGHIDHERTHENQLQLVTDVSNQHLCKLGTNTPDKAGDDRHIQQLETNASTGLSVDYHEGTGISVLLMQGLNDGNCPVVQGRAFSASNIFCSEPSYARDNMSAMKCSFGREGSSASSSVDHGSSKQTYGPILCQLSTNNFDIDNARESYSTSSIEMGPSRQTDAHPLCQSRSKKVEVDSFEKGSSTSSSFDVGSSTQTYNNQVGSKIVETEECVEMASSTCAHNIHSRIEFSRSPVHTEMEEVSTSTVRSIDNEVIGRRSLDSASHANSCEETHLSTSHEACTNKAEICENVSLHSDISRSSIAQSLNKHTSPDCCDIPEERNLNDGDCSSCGQAYEPFYNNEGNVLDIQERDTTLDSSFIGHNHMPNDVGYRDDISDFTINCSSLVDLEQQNHHESLEDVHNECISDAVPINRNGLGEATISDKHAVSSNVPVLPPVEETILTVEATSKPMERIFTLEEATDTVLFCSSIVHDIAYRAATIGMEKELAFSEPLRPTVTVLGNSVPHQMHLQKGLNKRALNARKVKRKRLETDSKVPSSEVGNDANTIEFEPSSTEISHTVDSTKPPKLESKCNCTVM